MLKRFFVTIAIVLGITIIIAKVQPLDFENPGNRRLLKTEEVTTGIIVRNRKNLCFLM